MAARVAEGWEGWREVVLPVRGVWVMWALL
jgi:hypothetical protein